MKNTRILKLVQCAILTGIIILFAFTPIGYLRIGALSITFMMIPVVIGSVLIGPLYGAFLGAVFGLTSFMQCFMGDAFGSMLVGISAHYTFTVCLIPRILAGFIPGLLFRAFNAGARNHIYPYIITTLCGSLCNTVFFVGALLIFFGTNDSVLAAFGTTTIWGIIVAMITINALIEAVSCSVVGTAISKPLTKYLK